MPLDTIYLTRHGHRLNWTIDYKTGTYHSQFPTPTGNPADPTLTSHGVRQSHELAAHFVGKDIAPKPFRIYSSPFYRCLQTIQPTVEALKERQGRKRVGAAASGSSTATPDNADNGIDLDIDIDDAADFTVRLEPGLGEWFGPTTFFTHPSPSSPATLQTHFPTLLPPPNSTPSNTPSLPSPPHPTTILTPSPTGESIPQLHNRLATTLSQLITDLDTEIAALEATLPPHVPRTSKAVLICSHAAPLIAMGRVLTGNMPEDSGEEDFGVFTAGVSTFVRRNGDKGGDVEGGDGGGGNRAGALAPGTKGMRGDVDLKVPEWKGGRGVGGGWECVRNGDCGFLSGGAERGWHFNGEEDFDTGPMAGPGAVPTVGLETEVDGGSKL
ncbi:hypothetical protein BO71DRAFT_374821 [Aspergillus ellipticus CBS 707.79]|uniref:Phosphoglycerate mutase family protein n=1 Tax=Aspergillus ellipticus CBS 707.79 TaxID=1448320 RepID=A0A319DH20_9EURO|nr:hypothetical protein BO71DRAFT_374821 [Aspergillus ellipticus CBS 707.79]